jgi:hypothetical protein
VGPALKTGFKVPNLAAFSKVKTAADIDKMTVAAKSVTFKSCPVLTIPPFLMGVLMHEESPDPSNLCMAVIRFCRDFNAQRNRDVSDTAIAVAAKPNDNASDDEEVDEEDADGDKKLAASVRAVGKKLISQDAEDEDWEMTTNIDADGNVIEASTMSPA